MDGAAAKGPACEIEQQCTGRRREFRKVRLERALIAGSGCESLPALERPGRRVSGTAGPCLGHPIRGRRSRPGAVALAPRPRLQQRGEPVFSHALPVVFHRATSSPPAQRREEAGRVFTTSQRAAEALCG